MKLLLNNTPTEVKEPADKTILQYVREQGQTGTKEGCASGDCGACTVMVGTLVDGHIHYHTINSCLVPLGQLAGRQLVTVEGLIDQTGRLHPAQSEMVACHGSQCGYCTPGFVMSLACLVENKPIVIEGTEKTQTLAIRSAREAVLQGISGNLCRCTGYRPIVDAGLNALAMDYSGALDTRDSRDMLAAVQDDTNIDETDFHVPRSEQELRAVMTRNPMSKMIAGGTDLMLEVTQRFRRFESLIDVSRVKELSELSLNDSHYVIGAAVPYTQLEQYFAEKSAPLVDLLNRLGSRQIRNSGTIGGNLANGSPIADMPPILIAWRAEIELVTSAGQSRRLPVEDFYQGYRQTLLQADEYIARIFIPLSAVQLFHRFYKSSKRIEDDISSVMGAFSFTGVGGVINEARIAFGGMAATPVRLMDVETALIGETINDAMIARTIPMLDELMTPLTDVRASADYRSAMARAQLQRALEEFIGRSRPVITEVSIDG